MTNIDREYFAADPEGNEFIKKYGEGAKGYRNYLLKNGVDVYSTDTEEQYAKLKDFTRGNAYKLRAGAPSNAEFATQNAVRDRAFGMRPLRSNEVGRELTYLKNFDYKKAFQNSVPYGKAFTQGVENVADKYIPYGKSFADGTKNLYRDFVDGTESLRPVIDTVTGEILGYAPIPISAGGLGLGVGGAIAVPAGAYAYAHQNDPDFIAGKFEQEGEEMPDELYQSYIDKLYPPHDLDYNKEAMQEAMQGSDGGALLYQDGYGYEPKNLWREWAK